MGQKLEESKINHCKEGKAWKSHFHPLSTGPSSPACLFLKARGRLRCLQSPVHLPSEGTASQVAYAGNNPWRGRWWDMDPGVPWGATSTSLLRSHPLMAFPDHCFENCKSYCVHALFLQEGENGTDAPPSVPPWTSLDHGFSRTIPLCSRLSSLAKEGSDSGSWSHWFVNWPLV